MAKASIQLKIPESMSDVEAATLGVSTITVVSPLLKNNSRKLTFRVKIFTKQWVFLCQTAPPKNHFQS